MQISATPKEYGHLEVDLGELFDGVLSNHPFYTISESSVICKLLPHYLAMSQAFPYIQAGSQSEYILNVIAQGGVIDKGFELTSVVGNFLSWDETGGAYVLGKLGKSGLPRILETEIWFHANMLKKDIISILGLSLQPDFSGATRSYLLNLYRGLSSQAAVVRCAYMVAFEAHAQVMIFALWEAIQISFKVDRNELIYFKCHVGDDDPAEIYHTQMTRELIGHVVDEHSMSSFIEHATQAMNENINWCAAIMHR